MLSFEEIEDCFPDGACSDDATGKTLVSAQWLHDFAHVVAAKERHACAKVCFDWAAICLKARDEVDDREEAITLTAMAYRFELLADQIMKRSNLELRGAEPIGEASPGTHG